MLEFNLDHPLLSRLEVRQAIAHALDREERLILLETLTRIDALLDGLKPAVRISYPPIWRTSLLQRLSMIA